MLFKIKHPSLKTLKALDLHCASCAGSLKAIQEKAFSIRLPPMAVLESTRYEVPHTIRKVSQKGIEFVALSEILSMKPQDRLEAGWEPCIRDKMSTIRAVTASLAMLLVLIGGCSAQSTSYELSSYAPAADQLALASYHTEEAQRLKQKSEESLARAVLYDRLFGSGSEWARGARLLAQFYMDAAEEQTRLAEAHADLAHGRQRSSTAQRKKED